MFIKPCLGRITSHFNMKRLHPITKRIQPHYGIDLGSHADNNILAAESGLVTRAAYITGYGNVVYVSHMINGHSYQTRYAHLKSFNVKQGDSVKQGDVIGIKGTTGDSTGIHLHFEVRIDGVAVNPVGYINDPSIALFKGVTGPRVGDLQRKLNLVGYNLVVDDSFGAATDKAVKSFQRDHKLVVDGSVGPATFKLVDKIKPLLVIDGLEGPETIKAEQRYHGTPIDGKISDPSLMIKARQKLLGVKQDGYAGPITIKAEQKRYGTPADGIISKPSMMIKERQRRLNKGKL